MGAGDLHDVASNLPPWLQWGANAAIFIVAAGGMVIGIIRGVKTKDQKTEKDLAPDNPMATSEVRRALADVSTLADTTKIIAESMKVMAAAASSMAKTMDEDFDQRRIDRIVEDEVEKRLETERRLRRIRTEGKSPEAAAAYD